MSRQAFAVLGALGLAACGPHAIEASPPQVAAPRVGAPRVAPTPAPEPPSPARRERNALVGAGAEGRVELAAERYDGGSALALSPDGSLIAVGAPDHAVAILDATTLHETLRLRGATSSLSDTAFSPDSATIAIASVDGSVRLFALDDGRELQRLEQASQVKDIAFTASGKTLLVDLGEGPTPWALGSGEPEDVPRPADSPVSGLAQLGRDTSVTSAGGKVVRTYRDVTCVATSPDGRRTVLGLPDHSIRVLEGAVERRRELDRRSCTRAAFSPDGRSVALVFSYGHASTLVVMDVVSGAVVRRIESRSRDMKRVAFVGPGVVVPEEGEASRFIRVATGEELLQIPRAAWKADVGRQRIAWVDAQGLHTADLATGARRSTAPRFGVLSASLSADGKTALAVSDAGAFLAAADGSSAPRWLHGSGGAVLEQALLTPDGRTVVSADAEGRIAVWDAAAAHETASFALGAPVAAMALAPDGAVLVVATPDAIRRVALPSGEERSRVPLSGPGLGDIGSGLAPLLSRDGRRALLLASSYPTVLRVIDTATGSVVGELPYQSYAASAAFLDDGSVVVAEREQMRMGASAMRVLEALKAPPKERRSCDGETHRFRLDPPGTSGRADDRQGFSVRQLAGCGAVAVSGRGATIAIAQRNWIDVRAVTTGLSVAAFDDATARSVALSDDGGTLVAASDALRVYSVGDRALRFTLEPLKDGGAALFDAAGDVELFGAAPDALICRVGARALPVERCAGHFRVSGAPK